MSKVKSLEELMKIKEQALQSIKMRESGKRGKIIVAM
ncbi:MAG: (2Fe-2S) ferredoxin domain-containing protein, partial [Fervidobacterium sp.]